MSIKSLFVQDLIASYFREDDLFTNFKYINELPSDLVNCSLKIKEDMVLAGLPFFIETFKYLGDCEFADLESHEGKSFKAGEQLSFALPFSLALTGERIALNLLQKASAVATYTKSFVDLAEGSGIKILDTRKTTPGHRSIEKYAVNVGGGHNHRFGQMDCWMIKDNHKSFFGGLGPALNYFKKLKTFYTPIVVEIHDLKELNEAIELKVAHVMLDNFSPSEIEKAVTIKPNGMTYEVSGGIDHDNLKDYLLPGVDAISSGSLTYNAPHVDISLKYEKQ